MIHLRIQKPSPEPSPVAAKPRPVALPFRQKYFPSTLTKPTTTTATTTTSSTTAATTKHRSTCVTSSSAPRRPLHVPTSVRCPPVLDPFGRVDDDTSFATVDPRLLEAAAEFSWLDRQANNNSGETSSRKVAAKEMSRREVENYFHMHFRFRMESYQSLVYAVKQSAKEESVFSEDHLDKWTLKMKFRIRRSSPLKTALLACVSRLGLENDPDVVFCTDGFYGDSLSGRIHNKNEVPNRVVQSTSTCRAMGLCNGSCVFVSRCSRNDRENAAMQMQMDLLRGADNSDEDADCEDGSSAMGDEASFSGRPRDSLALSIDPRDFKAIESDYDGSLRRV